MSEQEVITEETEDGVVEKKKGKKVKVFEKNSLYHSDDFLEHLDKWYAESNSYKLTANQLNQRFGTTISPVHVKNLYLKYTSKRTIQNEEAKEFFENSFSKMKSRWEDAWDMIGDLVTEYKKLREKIKQNNDTDQTLLILKMTPTIISIAQEIRKQLEFIRQEQEQIKIQQTNLIYSPVQINQHINNLLGTWIKEGYIKVVRKIPSLELEDNQKEEEDGKEDKT